jgi:hypothetical protein
VVLAQGNLPEALKSYHDSLAIGDRLACADGTAASLGVRRQSLAEPIASAVS